MRKPFGRKLTFFLILALLLVAAALAAPLLCPYPPYAQDYAASLLPPSLAHPFGTDLFGRDMLSRVIMGAQVSVLSTLVLVGASSLAGTLAGVFCGWKGGTPDRILTAACDLCLAFPGIVLALAVAAFLGGGIQNAVLALALTGWPKYARLARSQTLSLKSLPFLDAARLSGSSDLAILLRHILPNILGPILATASMDMGTMMAELAGLSFLGLGASPPNADWGAMMSGSRSMLQLYPWVILTPGIAVFLSVMIFNLLADGIRDYLQPERQEEQT